MFRVNKKKIKQFVGFFLNHFLAQLCASFSFFLSDFSISGALSGWTCSEPNWIFSQIHWIVRSLNFSFTHIIIHIRDHSFRIYTFPIMWLTSNRSMCSNSCSPNRIKIILWKRSIQYTIFVGYIIVSFPFIG